MHPRKLTPEIVADLYDAAIDEHSWPQFSAVVGKATGIPAVSVWLTQSNRVIDASMAEAYRPFLPPYLEHFGKLDPWAGSLARKPLDTVMLAYEHIRENELVKTEFYNDFARLGGMFRPIGVRMQLAPGVFATMGSEMPFAKLSSSRRISGASSGCCLTSSGRCSCASAVSRSSGKRGCTLLRSMP